MPFPVAIAVSLVVVLIVGGLLVSSGRQPSPEHAVPVAEVADEQVPATTTTEVVRTTTSTTLPSLPSVPAAEPSQLSSEIEALTLVINDLSSSVEELRAAGGLQQLAIRRLIKQPELQQPVFSSLSSDARASVEAAVVAGTSLATIVKPQESLPAWEIITPAPAEELLGYYRMAEARYGVRWQYLAAIHNVETRMGRIRGTSTAGAQGPMQFIPETWSRYGEGDVNSNHDSIMAAARLLVANGAPGNMGNALYRYNPSNSYVTSIEAYAQTMMTNERMYYGFYGWQVLYKHVNGTLLLPEGYPSTQPIPISL